MAQAPKPFVYDVINKSKYKGVKPPTIRSGWERKFAEVCDLSESILEWASEPVAIPYRDPLTGFQKVYIPDFLIAYRKDKGQVVRLLVEIKPKHETFIEHARNARDAERLIRNQAKWKAAKWWCQRRGISFQVMTESNLFEGPKAPPKVKQTAAAMKMKLRVQTAKGVRKKKATVLKRKTYGRWKKRR